MKLPFKYLFLFVLVANTVFSQNLLSNGNFESGGVGIGFAINGTGYTQITAPFAGTTSPGNFAITTNPQPMNTSVFITGTDHTSGTGKMLVIDGNSVGGNQRFWEAGNAGSGISGLTVGKSYTFSYWIKSVATTVVDASTSADIGIQIDNATSVALASGTVAAPLPAGGWQKVVYTFVPTNTTVNIKLWNNNLNLVGNDFAVDDFSLSLSLAVTTTVVNETCQGSSNGSITVNATGGIPPYTIYTLTGSASASNATGIFTNLPSGTYAITVTDSNSNTASQSNIVVANSPTSTATMTGNATICAGNTTVLTFVGTPNAHVIFTSSTGFQYSVNLDSAGNATFTTPALNLTTSYTLFNTSIGSCVVPATNTTPVVVTVNKSPYGTVVASTNNECLNYAVLPVVTFTGSNSTAPYTFTYNINGGTTQTISTVGSSNTVTLNHSTAAAGTFVYNLLSVQSSSTPSCSSALTSSVSIVINNSPGITMSNPGLVCPNSAAAITLTGSPNAVITIVSSAGSVYTVTLNAAGTAVFTTPNLTTNTTFTVSNVNGAVVRCTITRTVQVSATGCIDLAAGNSAFTNQVAPICEVGECRDLFATYQNLGQTSQYTVTSIPYCPPSPYSGTVANGFQPVSIGIDDVWSNVVLLPFNLCFYQNVYSSFQISSNGAVTFGTNYPANVPGSSQWNYTTTIPNTAFPIRNAIYGVYQDIDPSVTPTSGTVSVNYKVDISNPNCRKFIVNFSNVPLYSCLNSVGTQTSQIVMYETSNIIEVYVEKRTFCTGWNGGRGTIGIQNAAGTQAVAAPGRNASQWNTTNEAWRFTPSGPSEVIFQWLNGATPVSSNTNITVCPTATTVYTAQAQYKSCGTIVKTVRKDILVEVVPDPFLQPINLTKCITNNTFNLTDVIPSILGGLNPNDYLISFHTSYADALNITSEILPQTAYTSSGQIIYVCIQDLATGACPRIRQFGLIVNPLLLPVISCGTPTPTSVTFNWDSVSGATGYNISYQINSNPIVVVGGGVSATTYTYTVTGITSSDIVTLFLTPTGPPGSCFGASQSTCSPSSCTTITVPVGAQSVCIGGDPTIFTVNTTEVGTDTISYVYFTTPQTGSNMYTGGILLGNSTPAATLASYDAGTLGTTGSLPNIAGTYYVYAIANPTPTSAICRPYQEIIVIVNQPLSAGSNGSLTICDNNLVSIDLFGLITGESPGGTWTQVGTGGTFNATLGTFTPVAVTTSTVYTFQYAVTSLAPCPNGSSTVTITINPQPVAGTSGSTTICGNSTATINLYNLITGENSGGVWTQISGSGGVFNATGTFTPSTGATTSVFEYRLAATPPCVDAVSTATVTINANPTVTVNSPTVCAGATATVTATPSPSGTYSYAWTVPATATNPGDVASFTTAIAGSYCVVITDTTTSCFSSSVCGTVTINANPTVTVNSPTVCAGSTATVTATPSPSGTYSYAWTVPATATNPGDVASFTTTIAGSYCVVITDTTTSCFSSSVCGTVTINPNPTVTVNSPTVCAGSTATVTATPSPSGTYSYAWTVPATATNPGDVASFTTTIAGSYCVVITDTTTSCFSSIVCGTVTINANPTVTVNSPTVCAGSTATVTATPSPAGTYSYAWTVPATATNPGDVASFTTTIAGSYCVVITDTTTSCFSSSVCGTVTINPNPTVTVNSPTVCAGATATVTATPSPSGTYSYAWTVPATATNPGNVASFTTAIAGSYCVVITDTTTSCFSSSVCGTVTINPNPTVTVNSPTVCAGSTATVTATPSPSGTYSYAWTVPATATNPGDVASFTTAIAGSYCVVITDTTTSCFSSSVCGTVTINPNPLSNAVPPMIMCSTPSSPTMAIFNLPLNDSAAIGLNVGNYTVTYHETLSNAQNDVADLSFPVNAYQGNHNQIIYIRVENASTGCYTTTTVLLQVTQGPPYNTPIALQLCDDSSNDGYESFDLNQATLQILGAPSVAGISLTYHLTPTDAQLGNNAMPLTYTNNDPSIQTIYVRIEYTLTGCKSITQLQLIVNPKPKAVTPTDYHVCDDNADGSAIFDLSTKVAEILGTNSATNFTVYFYTNQTDANNGAPNFINPTSSYTSTTATLWVRLENNTTGCYDVVKLELIVDGLPTAPVFYPNYELCDLALSDGFETFNLTNQIPVILGTAVTFYPSYTDAVNNTSVLNGSTSTNNPSGYVNQIAYVQTIGIRTTDILTGCYVISTIDLYVNPLPVMTQPAAPLTVCDEDQDGWANIDLCSLNTEILGTPAGNYTLSYHLTLHDAQVGQNTLPCPYTNNFTVVQTIYVRAVDNITGCWSTMAIQVQVEPSPIMPRSIASQVLCDTDSNMFDGCTYFNFTTVSNSLLALQPLAPSNYTVTFYTTATNANTTPNGTSAIVGYNNYYGCDGNTIWVRIQNNATGCFNVGSFTLVVNGPTALTTATLYKKCDNDANPNNLYTDFDLAGFVGTMAGYTIQFYLDINHTQPINSPFTNTIPGSQTIFWTATNNTTSCVSSRSLTLSVIPVPMPNTTGITPIITCDTNNPNDGYEIVNATVNAAYILNNQAHVELVYYTNLADASIGGTSVAGYIPNPAAANVNGPIYIRVQWDNTVTFTDSSNQPCYQIVVQPVTINPLPLITSGLTFQVCDDDLDGFANFVFNNYNDDLLANPTVLALANCTFTYTDAAGNVLSSTSYTNTSNPQTITVTVVHTPTGCSNRGTFTIVVNPKPTLTAPAAFATCDSDGTNDGYFTYDLSALTSTILGSQLPADYTVNFYTTNYDPDNGDNPAPIPQASWATYQAYTQTLYISVTNNLTGCYQIGSFAIVVEQLPTPRVVASSDAICTDFDTNLVVRTVTLTAMNDTVYLPPNVAPALAYQWYNGTTLMPGETNSTLLLDDAFANDVDQSFSVVITNNTTLACTAPASASVTIIQSGQATPVAGTIGYTITNAFSENQIITVTVEGFGTYLYSLDDSSPQASPVFTNVSLGEHVITVWDTEAIDSCDPFVIEEVQIIDYPHYFTPNGDGIHDTWNVVGLAGSGSTIYIFDRFGKLLKQISPDSAGWDGTFNGNMLPATDYWFTVKYPENNINKEFKAHFTLKR